MGFGVCSCTLTNCFPSSSFLKSSINFHRLLCNICNLKMCVLFREKRGQQRGTRGRSDVPLFQQRLNAACICGSVNRLNPRSKYDVIYVSHILQVSVIDVTNTFGQAFIKQFYMFSNCSVFVCRLKRILLRNHIGRTCESHHHFEFSVVWSQKDYIKNKNSTEIINCVGRKCSTDANLFYLLPPMSSKTN